MEPARAAYWAVVLGVVGTLLVTGSAIGVVDVTADQPRLGGGKATVSDVTLVDGPAIEAGRFGTERMYARGPTAGVTVRGVTGTPRVLLRTEIPRLAYDDATWRVLERGARGTVSLSLSDQPFAVDAIEFDETTVMTTVRVQSYEGDRVVYSRNRTVEVKR